ncbi:MAG: Fic family protein [Synergistaceae bacterium]|nr:Fic family protein [Synergistaceae bacterium]MBQ3448410.1 Fic family protein [Synergistaceae bacterium]MBQ9628953.1 Fic family protein [Synergistaceae bacterium]MBR0251202.1 Fic family protein [Synergistaceae bacterium]
MIHFPVSERELEENYDAIMPVIDELSLQRRNIIWGTWPEFVKSAGTWECLKRIHAVMFEGLFEFAGMIRKKNILKGGFRFANALFLEKIIPVIEDMPQKNFHDITEKYIEMNIAHPFREGNGRVMRLWLDAILERELDTRINWSGISRNDYLSAMQRSPVNSLELEVLLTHNMLKHEELSDEIIFMASLNASYSYEKFS